MLQSRRIEFQLIDRVSSQIDRAASEVAEAPTFEAAMESVMTRQLASTATMTALTAHLRTRDALVKTVVSG